MWTGGSFWFIEKYLYIWWCKFPYMVFLSLNLGVGVVSRPFFYFLLQRILIACEENPSIFSSLFIHFFCSAAADDVLWIRK